MATFNNEPQNIEITINYCTPNFVNDWAGQPEHTFNMDYIQTS